MVRKKNKMFVDSADRTPHYSLRKLSVGVASVLLSTTLWMSANSSVAHADTINDATVAGKVEDKLDPSETHKDQTQAQTAESTSQASVASAEKQNGEAQKGQAQVAVANANQAEKKQAQEVDSANAEAQTATANDAQADVAKQEPAAQSQQTAPQAQVPASAERQASTAEQAAGQASAAATEGQTNGSANAGAAIDATTKAKKDSANPEANSSDAATEGAKNESTTLDVSQDFKTSTAATVTKKMVMSSLADSISENKTKLAKANADTTAVPGFSVTDPEYPSEMYRDPDPEHYTFFWVGQTDNGYQTVISTNRNGDGQVHVFELDQNNNVLNSFDLDKNQSDTSRWTGVTYYNDEYAGLVTDRSPWSSSWTIKYEVSGGKSDLQSVKTISFIVPRLNTQVTSYQDEDGKDIIDSNGEKIEPVVQQGLDGQKYTTTDTKVIDGYYAIAPANAQGTMSPYGKIGSTYEKNWHDGYSAVFTQTDNDGTMSVQMYEEHRYGKIPVNDPIIIKPGDNDIYSGVGNIYLRSIYVPQTNDIRYVYKKLGNTVLDDENNNPFKGNTPTQYPNDPNDPTKAGKVVIPQYEGYTPKINGVPVGPDGFIPNDPGEDTKVVYTANDQTATITYIDDTDKKTLGSDSQNGKFNQTITFEHDPTAKIANYEKQGYVLVSNNFDNQKYQADNKANSFEVHLKHGTESVSRKDDVNMTVHYVMDDGSDAPSDNKQTLSFTENGTQDLVTKDITWTPADSKTFKDVDSPVLTGYTPGQDKVTGQTVKYGDGDVEVTVTYTANKQTATITYIDDTDKKTLGSDSQNGKFNQTITFEHDPTAKIANYEKQGYVLVSNNFDNQKYQADNKANSFEVHLKHGTITVTPENPGKPGEPINPGEGSANYPDGTDKTGLTDTVNRTITYVMSDGSKAPEAVHDSLSYTASKVIDKVTGEVLETKWSANQDFKDVVSPDVTGYTPDVKTVSNKNVAHDAKDIDVVVTYTANSAAALVQFIDNTENRTLDNLELSGKTGETIDFAKANAQLKSYLDHGYKLVANGIPTKETKFDTSDDTDVPSQVFVVRLDHTMTPGETTVPSKQTVTYVYKDKDGKVVKTETVEQDTTFTGKTTTDEVTGETTTTWDPKDHKYTEVTTPVEPGYTADKKSVGGETVTPDDPNRSYTVVYTPNGSIVPVDPNGNPIPNTPSVPYETDPKDPTKVVDGKVPEVPSWTPKNGKPGDPVVPTDPSKDTKVPYDHTITPGKTTTTGKEEGLPEKPAKSAKAPAEKLVKTPVKAPKAVKTAEPAKTISIKESAQAQDQLPQTGEDNSKAAFGLGLASILGGIGILGAFKRKKKEN